jgi:peptidoglycan/LPS O-acetylase OafA/YrhL
MRFELLDGIRGVAAVWVLMFHYRFSDSFQTTFPLLHRLVKQGEMGVAMFFVVSGYCLTASARSALNRNESIGKFLYRRVKRIYPPFWCSLACVAAIPFVIEAFSSLKTGAYTPPSADNPHYGFLAYDLWHWLRVVTLSQAFYPSGQTIGEKFTSINAVYWSLAIEVQFYAVVALALACGKRMYLVLFLVTAASAPFALMRKAYLHGIFLPWWPMFGAGIALYCCLARGWTPARFFGRGAAAASAFGVGSAIAAFIGFVAFGGECRHLCFAVYFALIAWLLYGSGGKSIWSVASAPRPLQSAAALWPLLGAMSYSIYLIHGRLQFLADQIVRQVVRSDSITRDVLVVCLTCAACYPFYRWCEAPFFKSKPKPQPSPVGAGLSPGQGAESSSPLKTII